MPLIVGDLLTDPAAQSFISLSDAVAYLQAEASGALPPSPLGAWITANEGDQESSLVKASRWMAVSLPWRREGIPDRDLERVAHVAARMAVLALSGDLWAAEAIGKSARRYKAGSVEIEYHAPGTVRGANAGGKRFPWVYPMLAGLICAASGQHDVVRR